MKSTLALAVALLLSAVLVAPTNGVAAGASTPSLSSESAAAVLTLSEEIARKETDQKTSSIDEFVAGYKAAYALIYDKSDYEAAIATLRALDRDNNPDGLVGLR